MKFWIFWGFDAVIALVAVYFFVVGILDGSVSSSNMVLWGGLLLGLAAVLGGSILLRAAGHPVLGLCLLLLLAIPGLLACLFMLAVLILKPRWN
jgi:hypothetical protein